MEEEHPTDQDKKVARSGLAGDVVQWLRQEHISRHGVLLGLVEALRESAPTGRSLSSVDLGTMNIRYIVTILALEVCWSFYLQGGVKSDGWIEDAKMKDVRGDTVMSAMEREARIAISDGASRHTDTSRAFFTATEPFRRDGLISDFHSSIEPPPMSNTSRKMRLMELLKEVSELSKQIDEDEESHHLKPLIPTPKELSSMCRDNVTKSIVGRLYLSPNQSS